MRHHDYESIPKAQTGTATQKQAQLQLLLGQIANYCPFILHNTIVKNSTSLGTIWQAIRAHFGFQSTGAHFLDFNDIHLEPDKQPEDLYSKVMLDIMAKLSLVTRISPQQWRTWSCWHGSFSSPPYLEWSSNAAAPIFNPKQLHSLNHRFPRL
jgi:hypothetical protein